MAWFTGRIAHRATSARENMAGSSRQAIMINVRIFFILMLFVVFDKDSESQMLLK